MSVSRGRSEPRYTRVSGTESEPLGVTGSLIPERAGDHKRAESSERVGLQELERAEGASLANHERRAERRERAKLTDHGWCGASESLFPESAVAPERAELEK
jgi:hypothetical protein